MLCAFLFCSWCGSALPLFREVTNNVLYVLYHEAIYYLCIFSWECFMCIFLLQLLCSTYSSMHYKFLVMMLSKKLRLIIVFLGQLHMLYSFSIILFLSQVTIIAYNIECSWTWWITIYLRLLLLYCLTSTSSSNSKGTVSSLSSSLFTFFFISFLASF